MTSIFERDNLTPDQIAGFSEYSKYNHGFKEIFFESFPRKLYECCVFNLTFYKKDMKIVYEPEEGDIIHKKMVQFVKAQGYQDPEKFAESMNTNYLRAKMFEGFIANEKQVFRIKQSRFSEDDDHFSNLDVRFIYDENCKFEFCVLCMGAVTYFEAFSSEGEIERMSTTTTKRLFGFNTHLDIGPNSKLEDDDLSMVYFDPDITKPGTYPLRKTNLQS